MVSCAPQQRRCGNLTGHRASLSCASSGWGHAHHYMQGRQLHASSSGKHGAAHNAQSSGGKTLQWLRLATAPNTANQGTVFLVQMPHGNNRAKPLGKRHQLCHPNTHNLSKKYTLMQSNLQSTTYGTTPLLHNSNAQWIERRHVLAHTCMAEHRRHLTRPMARLLRLEPHRCRTQHPTRH